MVYPTDKVSCPKGVVDGERPLKFPYLNPKFPSKIKFSISV
jgi:hypothetical protein